ncbi:MAG: type IV secretory system conjugative DNA transfer family protein [Hyphomicrobiales bacterium]
MSARRSGDNAILYAIAGVYVVFLLLAAGGLLSAFLSGHGLPEHHVKGAIAAFAHAGDPAIAWQVPVGPAWLYWTATAVVVLGGAIAATFAVQYLKHEERTRAEDPTRAEGLADRHDVVVAAGAKHLLTRGPILRPSVVRPVPRDLGLFLGTSRRVDCYASVEDSMVILGPPRSGKGYNLVIPFILDAPGAVVTTSTRSDNLAATMTARTRRGPVGVFDPQGLAQGVLGGLRWSPIRGCEHPRTALIRASALCAGAAGGVRNANFWQQQTEVVVRCLLQAAAVDDRTVSDLYRWSLSPDQAKEAVEILKASTAATPLWGSALGSVVGLEPRQRANIWSVVGTVFAPLASPQVIEQLSPELGAEFHSAKFLRDNGTLYLLGTSSGASATANFVSALIEDVVETARQLAGASAGARLDPPVSLVLDEAANYPLPSLGALMSEGGGTGITTVAVLQSLAQARDRWGSEQAQAIWDSAIAKVILGGSSNAGDLRDIAQLIGERDHPEVSTTHQSGGGRNISETTRQRSILDPSMIRSIKVGHGLLMLRAAKPIMLTLRPWTARADAKELMVERTAVEESLRTGALLSGSPVGGGIHA